MRLIPLIAFGLSLIGRLRRERRHAAPPAPGRAVHPGRRRGRWAGRRGRHAADADAE